MPVLLIAIEMPVLLIAIKMPVLLIAIKIPVLLICSRCAFEEEEEVRRNVLICRVDILGTNNPCCCVFEFSVALRPQRP